jgi:hypothetical protein
VVAAREEKCSILGVKPGRLGHLQTRHPREPGALKGWRRIDQQGTYGGTFCLEGYPCRM